MAFDVGSGFSTLDCESSANEPDRIENAAYMIVVRAILCADPLGDIYHSEASFIQMRKTIHSTIVEQMVFPLVVALPPAPVNAALLTADARFFESLFGHLFQTIRNT